MGKTAITVPDLPRSKSPLSHAVKVGNLIFVSGFPGYDQNLQVPKGDFGAQMRLALLNLKRVLEYAGSSLEKVAKVNIYLDSRANVEEMNNIYREFFGAELQNWPARTTIEARLPRQEFLLEIDCVAEA